MIAPYSSALKHQSLTLTILQRHNLHCKKVKLYLKTKNIILKLVQHLVSCILKGWLKSIMSNILMKMSGPCSLAFIETSNNAFGHITRTHCPKKWNYVHKQQNKWNWYNILFFAIEGYLKQTNKNIWQKVITNSGPWYLNIIFLIILFEFHNIYINLYYFEGTWWYPNFYFYFKRKFSPCIKKIIIIN